MTLTLQDLEDASSNLPAPERAELARFLVRSLEYDEGEWAEEWGDELARRLEEIRSGRVVGVPAEVVIARLRERYP